jgi:hypothetical protein
VVTVIISICALQRSALPEPLGRIKRSLPIWRTDQQFARIGAYANTSRASARATPDTPAMPVNEVG